MEFTYKRYNCFKQYPNGYWITKSQNVGYLRSDTKAGLKSLINSESSCHNSGPKTYAQYVEWRSYLESRISNAASGSYLTFYNVPDMHHCYLKDYFGSIKIHTREYGELVIQS